MASRKDRLSVEVRVLRQARKRLGLITRKEARALGMSDAAISRRVASREWEPLFPGVFRLASSIRSFEQLVMAACLWGGPGTAACGRTAARLWKLDGCNSDAVEICLDRARPQIPGLTLRYMTLERRDRTQLGCIPITTVARTLVDLGGLVTEESLESALDCALVRGSADLDRVSETLKRLGPRRRGTAALRRMVDERRGGAKPMESVLEVKFFRLLRRHRIPLPVRQHHERTAENTWRIDFAYPDLKLIIELHGYDAHGGRPAFVGDRRRHNQIQRLGWRILYFTWDDVVGEPEEVVALMRHEIHEARRRLGMKERFPKARS